MDRPPVRIRAVGLTYRDRLGDRDREVGQPFGFEVGLSRGPVDTGESDDEVVAEPPDGVVGSPRFQPHEWPVGQARHLGCQQPANERLVDDDLVVVHANGHGLEFHRLHRAASIELPRCGAS
jgi:hypothetical protein